MTQELKEQIQVVAEYDGATFIGSCRNGSIYKGKHKSGIIETFRYNVSYSWLIPVAKKVCNELDAIRNTKGKDRFIDCTEMENEIESLLLSDISNLFAAVHAAIVFLNAQKKQK